MHVSCQLFAYNFANIYCTAVKLTFLESPSKMASDEYDFEKFFKKSLVLFWKNVEYLKKFSNY